MGSIDVGGGATNRATGAAGYTTWVDLNNPANDTGTLTTFELWALNNMSSVKMGTFSGSGTSYDDRDYETIGAVTAGSKQTFSGLDCTVNSGDFIGLYFVNGNIESDDTGGSGSYYAIGDKFGGGSATYTLSAGDILSLYATGATAGWANITKVDGIASSSISKVKGVAVASIAKINGVAV